MNDIRLICLDVDNTLVDDKKNVPQGNLDAIRWAHVERGVHIAINSGRIAPSTRDYMLRLGVREAFPSLGGCVVQRWDGSIIEEHFVDQAVAIEINNAARALGCTLFVYHHDNWYLDSGNEYWEQSEYNATLVKGIITDTNEVLSSLRPNKLLGVCLEPEKVDSLKDLVLSRFSGKVDCFKSSPYFLEVVPKGVNKGTAVQALCRHYGIGRENVMSIGDFYNDVDMFAASGLSVAMANSPADIKALVSYVTEADYRSCGVAEAIRRFVL